MAQAQIFQMPKSAMSSGRARTQGWVLTFSPEKRKLADPLMGWAGGAETAEQVRLTFPTLEAATAFAEREGLAATVVPTPERRLKLQAYADNFR